MPTLTTPTTLLEAVNEMLTASGASPVNTLDAPAGADVAIAKDMVTSISREVQSHGWWFNTSYHESLPASGYTITVPSDVLSVRPSRGTNTLPAETRPFVLREGRLYNPITASFNFTSAARADIIRLLEFEHLPESARRYITVRAARVFQTKVVGDEQLGVFNESHEQEAYQALEGDHGQSTPFSDLFMRRVRRTSAMTRPDPVTSGETSGRTRR